VIRVRGFSLVELMVAVTLALIVTAAVVSVFVGTRSAYQSTTGTAAVSDGGRFALDFIEGSVRGAGFMACGKPENQSSILNPGPSPLYYNFAEALGGFEATGTAPGGAYAISRASQDTPVVPDGTASDWAQDLDPALVTPPIVIKGNDVLVVRSTLQKTQPVYVTSIVDGAAQFTVNAEGGLAAKHIAVISDCAASLVIQISGVRPSGANAIISHHTNTGGPPGNSTSSFDPLSFQLGSLVTTVDTVVYYIGQGADGDGALFSYDLYGNDTRRTFSGKFVANELVPDIEAMQVLYGVDTSGTKTISEYVTADQVADFNTVMSVKVAVLAASAPGAVRLPSSAPTYSLLGTTVTAPIDSRARQVFDVTIAVRNALN
jgi:type IV pilus assembly protein PilW